MKKLLLVAVLAAATLGMSVQSASAYWTYQRHSTVVGYAPIYGSYYTRHWRYPRVVYYPRVIYRYRPIYVVPCCY